MRPSSVNFVDTFPPGGRLYQRHIFKISNGLRQSVTKRAMPAPGGRLLDSRKQVTPLDFQKFLPEYLENQKWASHKMLRPSSVQSFALSTFPPGGRLNQRQSFKNSNGLQLSVTKKVLPLITAATRQSFPPGGSLCQGEGYIKGFNLKRRGAFSDSKASPNL